MYIPGAIEVYGEADWRMGMIPDLPKPRYTFYDNTIQYNQLDTGATDCTIYASMGAVSDLTGKVWTLSERQAMHDMAVEQGLSATEGRWLHKAVDLVRKNSSNVSTLRVTINSEEFRDALELGYSVVTGYRGSRQYTEDAEDNCVVDKVEVASGGLAHCIRVFKAKDKIFIVDNYEGRKVCNVYRHAVFKEQVANGVFFNNGYIYFETVPMPVNPLPVHIKATDHPDYYNEILAWEQECGAARHEGYRPIYEDYIAAKPAMIATRMLNDLMLVRSGLWKLIDEDIITQLYVLGQRLND